ncbi:hypothetical protein [Ramlibacter albus]|uniref:Uncharacterized protein n=1 Tax=Ramlibacter albus TaxID=2079448 RepID=A0A923MBG6_9BURK|nr:hypothetical protein [Ramlibacter albus]MBC5766451.1 hypothetical protein [Ramlibacter albus]
MPDKTDQQRYDQTIAYIRGLNDALATHVDTTVRGVKSQIGADLSLTGYKRYAVFGNTNTGHAVRALMLCQRAYFGDHWARMKGAPGVSVPVNWMGNPVQSRITTKNAYLHKSTAVVNEAVLSYTVPATPATATLADTAERVGKGGPTVPPMELMARSNPVPPMGICYDGVYWWLYKAGFVSLRWLLRHGMRIDALNANAICGDGVELQLNDDGSCPNVPRGMIVNFRGSEPGSENTCHWTVSLGNGWLIGVNNTGGGVVDGQQFNVNFRTGGGLFGTFPLRDMWHLYTGEITRSHTTHRTGVRVAMIDPSTIPNRDSGGTL